MKKSIRVAVCGELPTACDFLLQSGVTNIDKFTDAVQIPDETEYHLILVYAPQGEGLLNTRYTPSGMLGKEEKAIPVRLLNEPCCHSALVELKSIIRRIEEQLAESSA